jgi:hypothetical protein
VHWLTGCTGVPFYEAPVAVYLSVPALGGRITWMGFRLRPDQEGASAPNEPAPFVERCSAQLLCRRHEADRHALSHKPLRPLVDQRLPDTLSANVWGHNQLLQMASAFVLEAVCSERAQQHPDNVTVAFCDECSMTLTYRAGIKLACLLGMQLPDQPTDRREV